MKKRMMLLLLFLIVFFQSISSQRTLYGNEFSDYGASKYDRGIDLSQWELYYGRYDTIERFEKRKDELQSNNDKLKVFIPLGIIICVIFSFVIYNNHKKEVAKYNKVSLESEFYMLIVLFLMSCSITLLFYGYYVMAYDPLHLYNGETDVNKWLTAKRYEYFPSDISSSTTNCFLASIGVLVVLRCLNIIKDKLTKHNNNK